MSERFGACPTCHTNDGYINVGQAHWFLCKEHRVKWCAAWNLFSSWMDETEEEQRKEYEELGLDTYTTIEEPYYGDDDNSDREAGYQEQSLTEGLDVQPDDFFDELDMIVPASTKERVK